jgi:SAM-dependent methyltransferase
MFHRLAALYDLQYAQKDYEGEVGRLTQLFRRYGRSGGDRWLDVACGTGRHLELLRRSFQVTGVDGSADMLRVARRRLPGVRLIHADMRSFRAPGPFDAVSCLFSAIGHLPDERSLQRTYENFARHLVPGGVAFIEPWIDPANFRSGSVHLVSATDSDPVLARMAYSRRRGPHSVIDYHFLVGTKGRGIETIVERDTGLLVSPARQLALLTRAGLRPRFLAKGFSTGRGLLVATKPRSASS